MDKNKTYVVPLSLPILKINSKNMSVATINQSEREFASNFLALLSVSDANVVIPADYKKDIKDISTLGIKLPNLPNPKKQTTSSSNGSDIEVSFKSIKPPRFNVSFKSASTNTIFEVKTTLAKQNELNGIQPSQIKLLVKGKVIQDSVLLSSITNDDQQVSFTVMINKDASKSATPISTPEPEIAAIEPVSNPEVEIPWDDIKLLLEQKGLDSVSTIERLQKGWELTK